MSSSGWSTQPGRQRQLPCNWRSIRKYVLARDGHQCVAHIDGIRCPMPATDVDHINGRDDHHPDNLQALCSTHHNAKTQAEAHNARARRQREADQHPGLL